MKRLLICLLLGLACGVATAGRPLLAQSSIEERAYDRQQMLQDLDEQDQVDWERGYSTQSGSDGITAMGVIVLVALAYHYKAAASNPNSVVPLVVATIFRDATLFRETVEYMLDQLGF